MIILGPKERGSRDGAVGAIKVLIVVASVLLLVMVAFLYLVRSRASARSVCCNCNLKQVGLAARMWANDHGDAFAWTVPMSTNGVKELATSGNVAALFRPMSNELNAAKILFCPSDTTRKPQADFSKLTNTNVSYFIGLDADETKPQTILSGDRNISGGIFISNRVMQVSGTNVLVWGADMHGHRGNLGMGDGSAQQVSDVGLQRQVTEHLRSFTQAVTTARFALP